MHATVHAARGLRSQPAGRAGDDRAHLEEGIERGGNTIIAQAETGRPLLTPRAKGKGWQNSAFEARDARRLPCGFRA